ncbi:MAG: DNA-3-methyladenine glycosylase [Nanoarchaeota archaeon]
MKLLIIRCIMIIDKDFFNRNAKIVAKELLGKILVRKVSNKELRALIVETEAYFDEKDPASRAKQKGDLRETMMMDPGIILVYGVHNNWLMNIITDEKEIASAVLIRAVEPLNFLGKCNGPGLLTKSLKIGKEFHKKNILRDKKICIEFDNNDNQTQDKVSKESVSESMLSKEVLALKDKELIVTNNKNNFEIIESFRIGVKKDLPKKLRFYIKDNKFVSRK